MIPKLDVRALVAGDRSSLMSLRNAATHVGFATVHNSALDSVRVEEVIDTYRSFFHLNEAHKRDLDMARTGSNRGWGAPGSEKVDPKANPDYKQFFDVGVPSAQRASAFNQCLLCAQPLARVFQFQARDLRLLRGCADRVQVPVAGNGTIA